MPPTKKQVVRQKRQHEVNYKRMAKEKAETEKRAATNIQRMWRGCIWRTAVQAVLMQWRIRRCVSSCVEAMLMRWRIIEVA